MTVEHVEVLVEEPSAEAALSLLLPKILGTTTFAIHTHPSKQDLLGRLPDRLRGYKAWLPPTWRIAVVVDRDDEDCRKLKAKLEAVAKEAGFSTKSSPTRGSFEVVNRLAIEELEAWFFGDWAAVREAYPKVRENVPTKESYRAPDAIRGGTWEAFERVLKSGGYFKSGLRKIEAARAVAAHMDPSRNSSPSFCALRDALSQMASR